MEQNVTQVIPQIVALATEYGLQVLGAIVILLVGWWLAGVAQRGTVRGLGRLKQIDETLTRFFASLARYTVLIFTALAVLNQFGVQTASLIAVLGAAGLAVGLALQGTLSNLAAGVMLLIFRPFRVGDYVEVGTVAGTVEELSLFVTRLNTPDNIHIIVPNNDIWGSPIKNYSHNATRRVEVSVGIGYEQDIGRAIDAVRALLAGEPRVLDEPEPFVAVTELADSSVNLVIRAWCRAGDYWPLYCDLLRAIKDRFDAQGISIPYPQQVVHMAPSEGGQP